MGLVLTVPQGVGPAVIAFVAEGKLRVCSGESVLYSKAQAVAATRQITLQLYAQLSCKVGVVLSCYMLVEDACAIFRVGLLVQPGKLEACIGADMPDLAVLGVEVVLVFAADFKEVGVVPGLCSKAQGTYATAQFVPNMAVVRIEIGIGGILVVACVNTETSIIDIAAAGLSAKACSSGKRRHASGH